MMRWAAIKRDDERLLSGADALAWLEPGQNHSVGKGRIGDRVDAQSAVRDGWMLVVAPRSSHADRAADEAARAAIANPVDRELWTPPAWRSGESCCAIQCPRCGHRLQPRSLARRIGHARVCTAEGKPYPRSPPRLTGDRP